MSERQRGKLTAWAQWWDKAREIDLQETQCITYSVEFIRHLHQLLVHLDPNVLALKHSEQIEEGWDNK